MNIEFHSFEGCPGREPALALLQSVLHSLGVDTPVKMVSPSTDEEARQLRFMGSPSILVNGEDVSGPRQPVGAMACRFYTDGPMPARWMVEAAVLRALKPAGILFLCVSNSARSQMAEGIARHLASGDVQIFSAGSAPAFVHPLSMEALEEIGIDISAHRSKGVEEIPPVAVDTVITLCAEEVCPVWLHNCRRVHWRLPDPAQPGGHPLEAFRFVRDELSKRLRQLID